jgi:prepilin-type N-terminal cleavage/methylation domain-containing protein
MGPPLRPELGKDLKQGKKMITPAKIRNGYSLVELMVVVSIVGVLVALAIPNFLEWNRKYQLKSDVSNLAGTMAFARMSAINQNIQVLVTVSQVPPAVVNVTFTNPNALPVPTTVFPAITMNSGVLLTNAAGAAVLSPQTMRFNTSGMTVDTANINNICTPAACPSTAQVLNFKNGGAENYRVVIKPTGKIVWCYSPDCDR